MSRLTKTLVILSVAVFVFGMSSYAYQQEDETVKCAVSGETMKKSEAKGSYEYIGNTYYFCCEETFMKNPEKLSLRSCKTFQSNCFPDLYKLRSCL